MADKTRATASSLPMMSACSNYESDNEGPKPHAEFGSLFHKAIEERDPSILLTEEGLSLAREAGKSRSQVEAAYGWAMDYLESLSQTYDIAVTQEELNGQCSLLPGRNFYIDMFILTTDNRVVVIDWKSSRSLDNYQADSCEQGWLYVAAVFELAPHIDEVDMIFVAPFSEEDEEYKTSMFTYCRSTDYEWLKQQLGEAVGLADDPDTQPTACSYCTWCKHYRSCSETTSIIAPAMEDRFGTLLERAKQAPILMAKLRDTVPVLTKVIEDIKSSANDMYFEEGTVIPGYKPIQTKGKTSVKDPAAILRQLAKNYGLDIDDIADYIKIDLQGIETVIRNKEERGDMKGAIEDFREMCDRAGWTRTGNGSTYLKKVKQKKELSS